MTKRHEVIVERLVGRWYVACLACSHMTKWRRRRRAMRDAREHGEVWPA